MAGGFVRTGVVKHYEGRTTFYVAFACVVAASGGLIFGYDLGISGGVTSMSDFLAKFFPHIVKHNKNNYCRYDNQSLQAFTSSLYLAGMFATFFAGHATRHWGRRPSILIGGVSFIGGAILNGAAQNLEMLIVGRCLLGIGVGFANQAVPLYISEMAPAKFRGALTIMFQSATTIGILCANLINYGTGKITPWGWRLSLGLAIVPGTILALGGVFLPETPNSLIERGWEEDGRTILKKIRGIENVKVEFEDLIEASKISRSIEHPFRNLIRRRYRPQLVMAIMIPMFQQLTGNNAITFYAPVLFKTIGFGDNASLYSAVIVGGVKVLGTFVSIATVDKVGRIPSFIEGGIQMLLGQFVIGSVFKEKLGLHNTLDKATSAAIVVLICVFVAGYEWSWGPLGWLVPSEIYPLEIRSAAQSITVATNFLFTFIIGQVFLTLFCHLQWGAFYLFGGFILIMTIFVALFLPETRGIPIEDMAEVWKHHWFWKTIVPKTIVPVDDAIATKEFELSSDVA